MWSSRMCELYVILAIAQLAEHLTVDNCSNQMVPGSIPGRQIPCSLFACQRGAPAVSTSARHHVTTGISRRRRRVATVHVAGARSQTSSDHTSGALAARFSRCWLRFVVRVSPDVGRAHIPLAAPPPPHPVLAAIAGMCDVICPHAVTLSCVCALPHTLSLTLPTDADTPARRHTPASIEDIGVQC